MRWIASLLIILVTSSAAAADKVYKIVRPDGTVEYSSEPGPDSEEIHVPKLPTYQPRTPVPQPGTASPPEAAADTPSEQEATEYRIRVTQPSQGQTIFFDAAGMPASVTVTPSLSTEDGHVVVFVLDGTARARVSGTSTSLTVERGSHTLAARIEAEGGDVLASSDPIEFYMRQHSRRHPTPPSRPGGAPSLP